MMAEFIRGGEAIQTHLVPLEKVTAPTSIISD